VHTVSHACPSGVEPVADATVLIDACHGRPPADTVAEVKLSGMKANWFKLRTSTFEDSGIEDFEFDEVEPGQVVIRQTVPDGYTQAMVFCADGTPDTATFGEPESWNEGAIIELEPGDVVTCRLFIFPAA
jgi:hypothetical protein